MAVCCCHVRWWELWQAQQSAHSQASAHALARDGVAQDFVYEPPMRWSNRELHVPVELTCEHYEDLVGTRLPSSTGGSWNTIVGRLPRVSEGLQNGFRTAPL